MPVPRVSIAMLSALPRRAQPFLAEGGDVGIIVEEDACAPSRCSISSRTG